VLEGRPPEERVHGWRDFSMQLSTIMIGLLIVLGLGGVEWHRHRHLAGAAHEVDLSWNAPISSPDPVAGYNIYRKTASGGSFVLINPSPDTTVVYVDRTVTSGVTYSYVIKSVDSRGVESGPSNQITVTIP
jgi:fibronectin type 3 domain-containing protein